MQDKINNATCDALDEIVSTMLFVSISPVSSGADGANIEADISAIVALSGGLEGGVRLGSPAGTAMALASALMGEDIEELSSDVEDAFGELANMVTGGIQTRLAGELGDINLSPPFVITGKNHRAHGDSSDHVALTRFELDGKPFFIEVFYSANDR